MTQPNDSLRGSGRTTRQMLQAPIGSVYIWCRHDLHYPRNLARHLQREDLEIVSADWLESQRWRGREFSGINVDHAAVLSFRQLDCLVDGAMTRVRVPVTLSQDENDAVQSICDKASAVGLHLTVQDIIAALNSNPHSAE